ncbi:MAG: hypothetical protein OEZ10_08760 [Gammaproteobacteria bacterium]|nr:hypothetical protein [Gammaproteobacteria bacterium]
MSAFLRNEKELIDASRALGSICESNSKYTALLAMKVSELGKPVEALTVGELVALHEQTGAEFNSRSTHCSGAASLA